MSEPFDAFAGQYDERFFPQALLACFEPVACLAEKATTQTFELLDRQTGETYIAKVYPKDGVERHESVILHALEHPGIPRLVAEYETDDAVFIVRAYAAGITLEERMREAVMSREEALTIMMQLCDIAAYLHAQQPPILHRDIKPSNIVISDSGQISLIDFETSRRYSAASRNDTIAVGTLAYAAPEQFGYSQTDPRSDIYAMGIVLLYLLTGESDREKIGVLGLDRDSLRIIRRCTAFAPEKRYPQAAALARDIQRVRAGSRRKTLRLVGGMALVSICLCGGFLLGFGHAKRQMPLVRLLPSPVAFAEPIVEQAVRAQLVKGPDEPIYMTELYAVGELYIYGNHVARTMRGHWNIAENVPASEPFGTMTTLDDLRHMPNLHTLFIEYQSLTDVSALAFLPKLRCLSFSQNTRLQDISALAQTSGLEEASFVNSAIIDASPLAAHVNLTHVDLVGQHVLDIRPLANLQRLRTLNLSNSPVQDLTPLLNAMSLEVVGAQYCPDEAFEGMEETHFILCRTDEEYNLAMQ